jgi:hypothetical protein
MNTQTPPVTPALRNRSRRSRSTIWSLLVLALTLGLERVEAQFTPGSGGTVPDIAPFTDPVGSIGGLRVYQTHRRNYTLGSGNHPELDLDFLPPSEFGATAYVLQQSFTGTSAWGDVPWGMDVLRTPANNSTNFSFTPGGTYYYRLRVEGGPRDGQVSNVVFAEAASVETRFAGWNVDTSMFLTGVMYPWVGHGMEASFTVRKLADESDVTGGLSLQWYRVHPRTWEMTLIPGATNPLYVTTNDDLGGWLLICRATGNQTTVGGLISLQAGGGVKLPNKAFLSHFKETGFRLNLHKSVPSLDKDDLLLAYYDDTLLMNVPVPIDSVTPLGGNASFEVTVNLPEDVDEFILSNDSNVWTLGEEAAIHPGMPPMFMEFITLDVEPDITVMQQGGKVLADNSGKVNLGIVKVKKRSAPMDFTVRNDGPAPLAGLSVKATGADANEFLITPPPLGILAPGASTTFKVTYKPRAKGSSKAKVQVRSNDRDENPFDINVTGKGK